MSLRHFNSSHFFIYVPDNNNLSQFPFVTLLMQSAIVITPRHASATVASIIQLQHNNQTKPLDISVFFVFFLQFSRQKTLINQNISIKNTLYFDIEFITKLLLLKSIHIYKMITVKQQYTRALFPLNVICIGRAANSTEHYFVVLGQLTFEESFYIELSHCCVATIV